MAVLQRSKDAQHEFLTHGRFPAARHELDPGGPSEREGVAPNVLLEEPRRARKMLARVALEDRLGPNFMQDPPATEQASPPKVSPDDSSPFLPLRLHPRELGLEL